MYAVVCHISCPPIRGTTAQYIDILKKNYLVFVVNSDKVTGQLDIIVIAMVLWGYSGRK